MFRIFKNKKKSKAFVALVFTFFVLVSFVPQQAEAATWTDIGTCLASVAGGVATAGIFGGGCFNLILSYIFYFVLTVFSWILGLIGVLFNSVFNITIVHMAENVAGIKIIAVGWAAIRDIANILFIFMLLYLAISTILQLDEHGVKHGLSRLIIGAVLINFSLFFVKLPIDLSNILATKIYNQIQPEGGAKNANGGSSLSGGLGDAFMQMFSLQRAFKDPELAALDVKQVNSGQAQPNLKQNPITTFVMGIILMFITAFVFLAVIIILVKRFITLVMLMIFSPLAFAGMAIPNHDVEHQISHDFWNTLFKESFYAPVFLFMIYLTLSVGKALDGATLKGQPEMSFLGVLPVGNIISYTVVMGMLIFSLTVSEKVGVKGASSAIGGFNAMRGATAGWIGTNTVSRAASTFINSKASGANFGDNLREWAAGSKGNNAVSRFAFTALGRAGVTALDKAGKPFDEKAETSRSWMEQAISNKHGDHKLTAELFSQASAGGAFDVERKAADNQFHHMSVDQKVNMKKHLEDMEKDTNLSGDQRNNAKRALDRYYRDHGHGRMETDEVAEVDKMEREKLLTYDRDKFKEEVFDHSGNVKTMPSPTGGSQLMVGALNQFKNFSDKQRADLISSFTKAQQDALAANSEFQDVLKNNLTKFDSIERVGKAAGITDGMKKAISDIAYTARARYAAYDALSKAANATQEATIMNEMRRIGHNIPTGATKQQAMNIYEADPRFSDDATFKDAEKNMTRFLAGNTDYASTMKVLTGAGYKP